MGYSNGLCCTAEKQSADFKLSQKRTIEEACNITFDHNARDFLFENRYAFADFPHYMPFDKEESEYISNTFEQHYDYCKAIAEMPKDEFMKLMNEAYEERKKNFIRMRNERYMDCLKHIPNELIELYMKLGKE